MVHVHVTAIRASVEDAEPNNEATTPPQCGY